MSSPGPVNASAEEPLPVLPVDEGLLTTAAATGDVVVVVAPTLEAGTVVVVVDVVDVVVDVVVVVEEVVVAALDVTEQHGAVGTTGLANSSPSLS